MLVLQRINCNWKLVIWEEEQVQDTKENEKNCDNCKHDSDYFDCSQCEDFDEWEKAIPELNKALIHEYICQELTQTYKKKK